MHEQLLIIVETVIKVFQNNPLLRNLAPDRVTMALWGYVQTLRKYLQNHIGIVRIAQPLLSALPFYSMCVFIYGSM